MKVSTIASAIALTFIAFVLLVNRRSDAATTEVSAPEARVLAFLTDYLRLHTKVSKQKGDFDVWKVAVKELDDKYFVNGVGMELATVMYGTSPHDPATEKTVSVKQLGDTAFVETVTNEGPFKKWYEYELRLTDAEWRITHLREFLYPSDKPFVDANDRLRLTQSKQVPLRKIPSIEKFKGIALSQAGRKVRWIEPNKGDNPNQSSDIVVRNIGKLRVDSGVLVAADFGYDASQFSPLALRAPPGRYDVTVVSAFGRNAALQVRFSNAVVKSWHPADATRGGHVAGVDAGNMAVFDVSSILEIKARDKDRALEPYSQSGDRPAATMLNVTNESDVAIADSGYGDGAYPVYWGLDAGGRPVMLVIDFFLSELAPL